MVDFKSLKGPSRTNSARPLQRRPACGTTHAGHLKGGVRRDLVRGTRRSHAHTRCGRGVPAPILATPPIVLRSDYITYTDTSDCLVSFYLLHPHTVAHVRYDLAAVSGVSCTIQSGSLFREPLYDINLGATHTTIPSTRGVQIPIYLVNVATDSF